MRCMLWSSFTSLDLFYDNILCAFTCGILLYSVPWHLEFLLTSTPVSEINKSQALGVIDVLNGTHW